MTSPLVQQVTACAVSRVAARRAAHLAALTRYNLTPDTCPVCRICPEVPR